MQQPATSFVPVGMADGNGGVFHSSIQDGYYDAYAINDDYSGTIAKATQLLQKAGFRFGTDGLLSKETPIELHFITNDSSGIIAIAEAIRTDLSVVGIDFTIDVMEWETYQEERKKGNFDVLRGGWIADFNDPINMLEMFASYSGNNTPQFGK